MLHRIFGLVLALTALTLSVGSEARSRHTSPWSRQGRYRTPPVYRFASDRLIKRDAVDVPDMQQAVSFYWGQDGRPNLFPLPIWYSSIEPDCF